MNKLTYKLNTIEATMFLAGKTNRLFRKGNKYKDEYVLFDFEKQQLYTHTHE